MLIVIHAPQRIRCLPHHINEVVKKGYISLHVLMRVFRGCRKDVKKRAYKSLGGPQLEYGSSIWDPQQDYLIREPENNQKKTARLVLADLRKKE